MGIVEIAKKYPALKRVWKRMLGESIRRKPRLAILTDFPGFHLRLARALKRQQVPERLFHMPAILGVEAVARQPGAPAICARTVHFPVRAGMVSLARRGRGFYRASAGGKRGSRRDHARNLRRILGWMRQNQLSLLLPGSRAGEIAHHMPPLMQACHLIGQGRQVQFVLALAPGMSKSQIAGYLGLTFQCTWWKTQPTMRWGRRIWRLYPAEPRRSRRP